MWQDPIPFSSAGGRLGLEPTSREREHSHLFRETLSLLLTTVKDFGSTIQAEIKNSDRAGAVLL